MLRRWSTLLAALALAGGMAAYGSATSANAAIPGVNPGGLAHIVPGSFSALAGGFHQAQSTNWSGYADTTGTFSSVSASWTEPTATCSRGDQYASFWVGIDGYNSGTVEQLGTDSDCVGRTPNYYAWWEMYPAGSNQFSNTVRPGDHISASVTFVSGQTFTLHIADSTQGWSHTMNENLGATPARSSAEAIVEAPCCTGSGGILPLANFGTINITGAVSNGEAIGTAALGPVEITMVDNSGLDKDTCSGLTSQENFSCTWIRSN